MRALTKFLGFIFFHSRLFQLARFLNSGGRRVPILMYHGIAPRGGAGDAATCMDKIGMSIPATLFEEHMEFITRHYDVISMDEYVEARRNKTALAGNPVVITFDDGFMNNYTEAVPVLKKYKATATFFVIGNTLNGGDVPLHRLYYALDRLGPGRMKAVLGRPDEAADSGHEAGGAEAFREIRKQARSGREGLFRMLKAAEEACSRTGQLASLERYKSIYMSQKEITDLIRSGFSIGGHSMGHESLSTLSETDKRKEIFDSFDSLRKDLPRGPLHFAYPFGQKRDFDGQSRRLLSESGYSSALTAMEGLNDQNTDLYELRRIDVRSFGKYELALRVTGAIGLLKKAAKSIKRPKTESAPDAFKGPGLANHAGKNRD